MSKPVVLFKRTSEHTFLLGPWILKDQLTVSYSAKFTIYLCLLFYCCVAQKCLTLSKTVRFSHFRYSVLRRTKSHTQNFKIIRRNARGISSSRGRGYTNSRGSTRQLQRKSYHQAPKKPITFVRRTSHYIPIAVMMMC